MTETQITSTFRNQQGEKIFFGNRIAGSKPKSIAVDVHGLNSSSEYSHSFANQLHGNGYEVYTLWATTPRSRDYFMEQTASRDK
ncbi:alpha-beta hydrolase superfamily lysophospholipase [Mucilaginibacter sp. SG538B]|uniref:hypothetical protein n=1 Tax=Mucilaginibacter sp. SG538B TaxID=2587021 RepID=UPI00159D86C9|nr:hypothetical protein [Mucilaginibacter sp. SG538B]NVM66715.1 alpha-beta hydrolase superfamily lysophospholipase [Mucilaginibacter sp. SG538B]